MTGNVAQVFVTDSQWRTNLRACHAALRTDGWIAFAVRNPEREAWRDWTPERTGKQVVVPGIGRVEAWCEVTAVAPPLVSFRWTYVSEADGAVMASDSTLRFRDCDELTETLRAGGFVVRDVRDAPNRPGAETLFLAQAV